MTEQGAGTGWRGAWVAASSTVRLALWIALAGHVLVLAAAASGALRASAATVAAIGCSIIVVVALAEVGLSGGRSRRVVAAPIGGHGVAAVVMLAGSAPGVPATMSLVGIGAAGGLGVVGLGHQLRELDAGLVQALATAGGVVVGAAIASSFVDLRTRHSAIVLLVGYAVFGLLVARTEHRIELVTDFPGLTALQRDRDLAGAIQSFALAGLMWQCWRQVAAFARPPGTRAGTHAGS